MTSLYKRATPSQVRILRIVEGAVKNAADSHRDIIVPQTFARSVAKRAAGTLSAQWPEVLALVTASDQSGVTLLDRARSKRPEVGRAAERRRSHVLRPSPLSRLHRQIGNLAGAARRAGQMERHAAFVEVLRMIAAKLQSAKAHAIAPSESQR